MHTPGGANISSELKKKLLHFDSVEFFLQLELLKSSRLANFIRFYLLHWQGQQDEAQPYLNVILEDESVQLRFKVRGCAMTGDVEQTIKYMEESGQRGAPLFHIRMLMASAVSAHQLAQIESTNSFHEFLERQGIDESISKINAILPEIRST